MLKVIKKNHNNKPVLWLVYWAVTVWGWLSRFWRCCDLCVCAPTWRCGPIRTTSVTACCQTETCCSKHVWLIRSPGTFGMFSKIKNNLFFLTLKKTTDGPGFVVHFLTLWSSGSQPVVRVPLMILVLLLLVGWERSVFFSFLHFVSIYWIYNLSIKNI